MKLKMLGGLFLGLSLTGCLSFSVVSMSRELEGRWTKIVRGDSSDGTAGTKYLETMQQANRRFNEFITGQGGLPDYVYVENFKKMQLLYMGKKKLYFWDSLHDKFKRELDLSGPIGSDVLGGLPKEFVQIKQAEAEELRFKESEANKRAILEREENEKRERIAQGEMAEKKKTQSVEQPQKLSGLAKKLAQEAGLDEDKGITISKLAQLNKLDYAKVNLYKTIESGQTLLEYAHANPDDRMSEEDGALYMVNSRTGVNCWFAPVRPGFAVSVVWPWELVGVIVEFPESAGITISDLVGSLNAKYPGLKPVQSVPSGKGGELKTVRTEGFFELKSEKTLEVLESDDVRIDLYSLASKMTPVKVQEESLAYQLLQLKFIVETHPDPLVKEAFKPNLAMLETAVKANDGNNVPGLDTTLREQMTGLQDSLIQQGMGELVLTARRKFRSAYANATPEGISLDVGQGKSPITMTVYDARRSKRFLDRVAEEQAADEKLKKAAEDKRKKEALAL